MKQILYILGCSALLSSCGIYKNYERPQQLAQGIDSLYRDTTSTYAVVKADTANFGNTPWEQVFTDPQLQTLIRKALANNTNLLNADLSIQQIQAGLKMERLAYYPSIAFSPQGTMSSWDFNKATKTYAFPIAASWQFGSMGTIRNTKKQYEMNLEMTKAAKQAARTSIIANVANLYYTLLMLDKQLELVSDMETLTKDTWETMKVLIDSRRGYRSVSVQAAESNYYSVLTKKADLKRQIRETENTLSLLLGEQAQTIARGKIEAQSLPTSFSTGVGVQLLNNRADVHAAEMALAQCFYGVETARSRFYPSITISGTGAFTNSSGAGIVNPGKWLLSAVGSLVQPLFQNGRLIAGLRVAKSQYEQAYNTWQNAVLKAGSEVSNALVLYNSSEEKSQIEAKQIEVLQKNVEQTRELVGDAGSNYLDIITAQSSLLNVQLSKVADDFNKMQAVVNLYYALGGGAK